MTVAENLVFGTPLDGDFHLERLAENQFTRSVLDETDLTEDFWRIGRGVAELMVDLFADVEPGSELFEQFSFIDAETLPQFKSLLARTESASDFEELNESDRALFLSLPFKLAPARHRLGFIDEQLQEKLLRATSGVRFGCFWKKGSADGE